MELVDLPDGAILCLDANIAIYHFSDASPQCTALMERIAAGELLAWIGAHALAEVAHRLMLLEAKKKGLLTGSNPARKLKERPDVIRSLTEYLVGIETVLRTVVEVPPITAEVIRRSAVIRSQHGFLVNDSLSVALMEAHGTTALATADRDFARLPMLQVYSPSDI